MPYVTSIERLGRQEGREEGRQEGRQAALQESILDLLGARFRLVPSELRERVEAVKDESELKRLLRHAALVSSLEEFARAFA